jgi:hypothetical protein
MKAEANDFEDQSPGGEEPETPPGHFTAAALHAYLDVLRELAGRAKTASDADPAPGATIPRPAAGGSKPADPTGESQPGGGTPAQSQR